MMPCEARRAEALSARGEEAAANRWWKHAIRSSEAMLLHMPAVVGGLVIVGSCDGRQEKPRTVSMMTVDSVCEAD